MAVADCFIGTANHNPLDTHLRSPRVSEVLDVSVVLRN